MPYFISPRSTVVETIVNRDAATSSSISLQERVLSDHRPALHTILVVLRKPDPANSDSVFSLAAPQQFHRMSLDLVFRLLARWGIAQRSTPPLPPALLPLVPSQWTRGISGLSTAIDCPAQLALSASKLSIIHVPRTRCKRNSDTCTRRSMLRPNYGDNVSPREWYARIERRIATVIKICRR